MAGHGTVRRAARMTAATAGAILLLPLLLAAAAPPWNDTADQPDQPAATSYPTPDTTGVPAGTTLTDYSGPCTITTAGTVIDARRVLCEDLDVNAPGVVIRNSEVHGEIRHSVAGEPLQVVDSTLGPPTGCDPGSAISEAHYTATRLEVRNVGDGFRYSGDNITVRDSYVKICDEAGQNEEWHADGMQGYYGGENAVFHHNTVDMPEEGGVTSPVFWADYSAGGLQLTDNLLMGGGYVIRVYHYGGARHVVSGNRVVNNRWGYGPANSDCGQIDWTGNTLVTIDEDYNVTSTVGALDCTGDVPRSAQAAVPARTVKVMTWNACGNNSACKYYEDPNGLIGTVRWHMLNHGTPMNAAIIQEFCSSFAKPLEYQLEDHYGFGWDVRFAPIKIKQGNDPAAAPNKQCVRGRGDYGIALAVPDENTWWEARYLPSANGAEWRVAMCATVESWLVKLCNAHFSYNGDDPTGGFRTQQVAAYQGYVWPSRFRVIFGGDLNLTPPGTATGGLAPIYDAFVECAQANQNSPRTGPGTYYTSTPHDNARTVKVDYLFTNPAMPHSCGVPSGVVESSDHRPMWITVNLPAA